MPRRGYAFRLDELGGGQTWTFVGLLNTRGTSQLATKDTYFGANIVFQLISSFASSVFTNRSFNLNMLPLHLYPPSPSFCRSSSFLFLSFLQLVLSLHKLHKFDRVQPVSSLFCFTSSYTPFSPDSWIFVPR